MFPLLGRAVVALGSLSGVSLDPFALIFFARYIAVDQAEHHRLNFELEASVPVQTLSNLGWLLIRGRQIEGFKFIRGHRNGSHGRVSRGLTHATFVALVGLVVVQPAVWHEARNREQIHQR